MCGIAGVFGPAQPSPGAIDGTLALMRQRGPDAFGHWSGRQNGLDLTLLHSRLAIVDLDPRSNQPFRKGRYVLIFNGEIYNYVEVREELRGLGHEFCTEGDTEVVLEAYRCWGSKCFDRFEGMWALALCDIEQGSVLLSRDRFGEKPLYWAFDRGTLFFASETRFLWPLLGRRLPLNSGQVKRYLVNGYKSLYKKPETFYEGVRELPGATFASLKEPSPPQPEKYWRLGIANRNIGQREAEEETRRLVDEAIRLRLRADVPIAFCLSGGVDSTALACIAGITHGQHLHAYSVYDEDERYDESENVEKIVAHLGCQHHITRTSRSGFLDRLKELTIYHDAPVTTISFYVQSFLAQAIRQDGYKVAITGNGADELFTGYYDHYNFWLASVAEDSRFDNLVEDWRKGYGKFVRNPVLQDPLCFRKEPGRRDHIYLNRDLFNDLLMDPIEENFFEEQYDADLLHSRMMNEIWHETLPVLLKENDLVFMQHSIENRTPFLDRRLAEFLFSLPTSYLIQDGYPKWLLRNAGAGRVPDSVRLDPRKRGFNAPIGSMLDHRDKVTREYLLSDGPIFDIIRRDRFESFLDKADERNSFSKFLFSFVTTKIFLEEIRTPRLELQSL